MVNFIAARLLRIAIVACAVVTVIFFLFKAVPGDQAALIAGPGATQIEIDAMRHQLGLDRPVITQYFDYMSGLLQGNFGHSSLYHGSPLSQILDRLPATLTLTFAAILLTVAIGIPAGVLAAVYHGKALDYVISVAVVALLSIPNFWIGLVLISVLSVDLGILPSFGFDGPWSLVMPTLALAARLIALVARMTRAVMLEELNKDYVRTARAKGLYPATILTRHVLRNALIPTVTLIGVEAGYLLGGSIVIERIFAWPGIGDLLINAIGVRDYNLVQGIVVIFVLGFLIINLFVDLLYAAINPRLQPE
jgi:ABC-type dipeptide/oligopeptide/nickel transport system permease component